MSKGKWEVNMSVSVSENVSQSTWTVVTSAEALQDNDFIKLLLPDRFLSAKSF